MNDTLRKTLCEVGVATRATETSTPARVFSVRIGAGLDAGAECSLGARPLIVGAGRAADLPLRDPKVSSRHCELAARRDGVWIKDLDSTNGTFVDGVRVGEALARVPLVLRIGDTMLRISGTAPRVLPPSGRTRFGALVGESLALREVFAVLELAAPTEATVLVQGESGTGKELVAAGLHDHSLRAARPFVVLDCSAAKEELIESQLFGHRRGAFTGAVSDRRGAFLEATGGTLFLDELGELPLGAQAKLLRALEDRRITPLGSDSSVSVDVRVVAATHRDLNQMVEEKLFRFDLFHRLAVVHVGLPPLRHRLDDLECLIRHFYRSREIDAGPIDGPNLELLQQHPWPGNVRELRNILERAWVLSGSRAVPFRELTIWLDAQNDALAPDQVVDVGLDFKQAKEQWNAAFERRYLAAVFARHGQNVSRAAAHAGINRSHFRKLLADHGLRAK